MSTCFRVAYGLCTLLAFFVIPVAAVAQERLTLEVGKSVVLSPDIDVSTVFVADPSIADASIAEDSTVFLFGRAAGETSLMTTELESGARRNYLVVVTHPISEIRRTLSQRFPGQSISVQSSRGSVLLTGLVASEPVRSTVVETLQSAFPEVTVIDRLTVGGSGAIRLQVRLLEVDRQRAENFGIDINATVVGSGWFVGSENQGVLRFGRNQSAVNRLDATIDVLVSNDIAAINQVTELSTVIGESAEFSVGGEIPVPGYIPETTDTPNGNFRLDYRFIGTQLTFTPTMVPGNKVQLLVESNVSADQGTSASVNGNSFPNLTSRSFRTSVEVVDGQSFAIAGLSRATEFSQVRSPRNNIISRSVDKLFGADAQTGTATEILVIVTPYLGPNIVEPQSATAVSHHTSNLSHILFNAGISGKAAEQSGRTIGGFRY